jgi:hypothetical protein
MTYDPFGGGSVDYSPCRYGASKLMFRGPLREVDGTHAAVIGGTETYGKFIETPYPEMLEQMIRRPVVNFGYPNAGLDAFLNDRAVLDICRSAALRVVEVTGAANVSNRYYAVHPRRNDRFLRATAALKALYPEIDFAEFSFTRHMLGALRAASAGNFELVSGELHQAWVVRMRRLLEEIGGPTVLLWISDRAPQDAAGDRPGTSAPMMVDAAMLAELAPGIAATVEIVADSEELAAGFPMMRFSELDAPAAREMLGPVVHRRTALRLAEAAQPLL